MNDMQIRPCQFKYKSTKDLIYRQHILVGTTACSELNTKLKVRKASLKKIDCKNVELISFRRTLIKIVEVDKFMDSRV